MSETLETPLEFPSGPPSDPETALNARPRAREANTTLPAPERGSRLEFPAWLLATLGDYREIWETAPTPANDLLRYSTEGDWTYPYAIKLRQIHWAYTCTVAVPATAATYPTALAVQRIAGLRADPGTPRSKPLDGATKAGQWALNVVARMPEPPPLVDIWHEVQDDAATRTSTAGRVAAWGIGGAALAVSMLLYHAAWTLQRPSRFALAVALYLAFRLT